MSSPASASSSAMAAPASFPECMKGQHVNVLSPYYDGVLKSVERTQQEILVKLEVERILDLSVGESITLEGHGFILDCRIESMVEVPEGQLIGVKALNTDVHHCSECWEMSVSTYKGGWDGMGMRFRRSGRGIVHEAVVQDVVRQGSFFDGVHLKFLSAPLPLHMGDRLVLESMDGQCQWEADVKLHGDLMFFEGGNDQRYLESVVVCVDDGKGSKLLKEFKYITVLPASSSTSFSTDNVRGAGLQRTNKARPDETHNRAKAKIKIGINGYGSIARTMIKIALDSHDLELIAINDPLLTSVDQATCMFRYNNPHLGWRSDFKVKDPNTLMFDEKEVTLFRINERDKIPWNKTGVDYIVEAGDYDYDTDSKEVRTRKYKHYSPNANPLESYLSPLAKVLHDMFGTVEDVITAFRVPVCLHIKPENNHATAAIDKVLPQWKGRRSGLIFKIPTVDAPPINIGIELAEDKSYNLMLSGTRPSEGFNILLGWCVEMTRQIPEVMYCELNFK